VIFVATGFIVLMQGRLGWDYHLVLTTKYRDLQTTGGFGCIIDVCHTIIYLLSAVVRYLAWLIIANPMTGDRGLRWHFWEQFSGADICFTAQLSLAVLWRGLGL